MKPSSKTSIAVGWQGSEVKSFAATAWQDQVYKKISERLRLENHECEEMRLLRLETEHLRSLRKRVLKQKYD